MPEIVLDQEPKLDILMGKRAPALNATTDMPVIETSPEPSVPAEDAQAPEAETEAIQAVPPDEGEAELTEESATSDTDEQAGHSEEKKVPRGVGKRLAELTKRAEAAEIALEQERQKRLETYEQLTRNQTSAELQARIETEKEPERPNRADYQDDAEWDDAMLAYSDQRAEFIARREIRQTVEREREQAHRAAIAQAQEETRQRHQARIDKALEKYPDFHEVAETPTVHISIPMAHAILHSEMGPDLQYFLGKNPAEAKRIMQLPPPSQLVELGKIEARLSVSAEPVKPAAPVSRAQPPIKPLRPTETAPANRPLDELSMDEYVRRRKEQQARARK